jgi:hypothetical protein
MVFPGMVSYLLLTPDSQNHRGKNGWADTSWHKSILRNRSVVICISAAVQSCTSYVVTSQCSAAIRKQCKNAELFADYFNIVFCLIFNVAPTNTRVTSGSRGVKSSLVRESGS